MIQSEGGRVATSRISLSFISSQPVGIGAIKNKQWLTQYIIVEEVTDGKVGYAKMNLKDLCFIDYNHLHHNNARQKG